MSRSKSGNVVGMVGFGILVLAAIAGQCFILWLIVSALLKYLNS